MFRTFLEKMKAIWPPRRLMAALKEFFLANGTLWKYTFAPSIFQNNNNTELRELEYTHSSISKPSWEEQKKRRRVLVNFEPSPTTFRRSFILARRRSWCYYNTCLKETKGEEEVGSCCRVVYAFSLVFRLRRKIATHTNNNSLRLLLLLLLAFRLDQKRLLLLVEYMTQSRKTAMRDIRSVRRGWRQSRDIR